MTKKYLQYGLTVAEVNDLSALTTLDVSGWDTGTRRYVNSIGDTYQLVTSGIDTPDGVAVVSATPSGLWYSQEEGRWDDVQGDISQGVGSAALTYEAFRDTGFLFYHFQHNQDDKLNMRFQLPHRCDTYRPINLHIHMIPLADPASPEVIKFTGAYAWAYPTFTTPAVSSWTSILATHTVNAGDVNKAVILHLATITPPAGKELAVLLVYVSRVGTDIADTYTTSKAYGTSQANLGLLSLDVHYRINKTGTSIEY